MAETKRKPRSRVKSIDDMLRDVLEHPNKYPPPAPSEHWLIDEQMPIGQNFTTYGAGEVPVPFAPWPKHAKLG